MIFSWFFFDVLNHFEYWMVCILNEQFIDEEHAFFSLHLMDILPLFCWNVINADAYVILSFIANINNLSINFM